MIEINDTTGPEVLQKEGNYLLMFYTDWCPRCPPLAEILDALQKNKNPAFEFVKINYDENPEAVNYFKVIGVPYVFIMKERAVIAGWGGLINKEAYERILDVAFNPPDKRLSQRDMDFLAVIGEEYMGKSEG